MGRFGNTIFGPCDILEIGHFGTTIGNNNFSPLVNICDMSSYVNL